MNPKKITKNKTHITLYLEPNFLEKLIGIKPKRLTYKIEPFGYISADNGTIFTKNSKIYKTIHKLRYKK